MLWFDATANWEYLGKIENIQTTLDRCVESHITDIIVDVKPNSGLLLYNSQIGTRMTDWKGVKRDLEGDYLQIMIDEGRKRGLRVHAAFNVFSEGNRLVAQGLVYNQHPEWQTILYTRDGFKKISAIEKKFSLFVNPVRKDVRDYQLSLIEELAANYDLDGLILDRGRFDSIQSDFSDYSRQAFEKFIGKPVSDWPQDIYTWEDGKESPQPGPLFHDWIFWRSRLIRDFFEQARTVVKAANPNIQFGDYAGSWYPTYYELGVNWASTEFQPDYDWARKDYHDTGYAEILDFFCSGCYFTEVTKAELDSIRGKHEPTRQEDAMGSGNHYWYCVEGACEMSMKVVNGVAPVYGSLYVRQYKEDPDQFRAAIQMALSRTDGVMIFDLVHINEYNWWDILAQTLERNITK